MANRIKGITVEIGGDTTKLQTALKEVNSEIRNTQSEIKDVEKLLKLDPGNVELIEQKYRLLGDAVTETREKLSTLETAAEQANDALARGEISQSQYDALQREIIETEQNLKSLEEQADRSGEAIRKIGDAGEKLKDLGGKISDVGDKLTTTVTLPLAAVGTAGVKNFAEVDKTMQLANKTMGNTAEQGEMLSDAMKSAASNSIYGMDDASNAILNFARAGLDAEQSAAALAPAMNLAAGEGGNLDTVSAGLVATINGFHGSFEDASTYADVFAAACNNSALDVDSLSNAMSVAAPVFSSAGYIVNDAALYMGVMANNGIEAGVAANSLKTGLARLVAPAEEGATMMEKLGISVTNADGSMKDSVTIQKELNDAFSKLSESEQIAAASAIFGKNQMSPWLALINTAPEDVDKLSDSLNACAGTTEEMADTMMGGFGGGLEKLKSSIDVLVYNIGESLAPAIQKAIDFVQGLVDKFNALTPEQQDMAVKIGLIAAAVGPLLSIIGRLTSCAGTLMTWVPKITAKLPGLASGFGAISAPVIAVVAAVAALVAAFVHLWNTNEEFRNKITAIWDGIKSKFESFAQGIVDRLNALGFDFENITEVLGALWDGFCGLLAPVFEGAFNTVAAVLGGVLDVLTGLLDVFIGLFSGNWEQCWTGVKEIFTGVFEGIGGVFSAVMDTILGMSDAVLSWFGTSWASLWDGVRAAFENTWNGIAGFCSSVWTGISTTAQTVWGGVSGFFSGIWGGITGIFASSAGAISNVLSGTWEEIKANVTTAFTEIQDNISSIWNGFYETFAPLVESFRYLFETVFEAIKILASQAFEEVKEKITAIWGEIAAALSPILEGIKTNVSTAWEAAKEAVSRALDETKSAVETVWNGIVSYLTPLLEGIRNTVTQAWESIKTTITNVVNTIKTVVTNGWNSMRTTVTSVSNAMRSAAITAFTSMKAGISSAVSGIVNTIKAGFNNAVAYIKNLASQAYTWGADFINGLVNGIKSGISKVSSAVTGVANSIRSKLHFSVPDKGPLADYESWMPDFIKGLANGIEKSKGLISSAIDGVAAEMVINPTATTTGANDQALDTDALASAIKGAFQGVMPANSSGGGGSTQTIKLVVDGKTLASAVVPQINNMTRAAGRSVLLG